MMRLPEKPLTEEQQQMMLKVRGMIPWFLKRFRVRFRGQRRRDCIERMTDAILRACQLFDPSKGFKLSTYVTYWLRSAVRDYRRNYVTNYSISDSDVPVEARGPLEVEARDFVKRLRELIEPWEFDILWRFYVLKQTSEQIAEATGIGIRSIFRARKRLIAKIVAYESEEEASSASSN